MRRIFIYEEHYDVRTCRGWFRLDRGAYRDYLNGMLWISWTPGCPDVGPMNSAGACSPVVISPESADLRRRAADTDFCRLLLKRCRSENIPVPYLPRMRNDPIHELLLSARADNCLKRAGVLRFGELWALIENNSLHSIRGLGEKSEREILRSFLCSCYSKLSSQEKGVFWQAVISQPRCAENEKENRSRSGKMLSADLEDCLGILQDGTDPQPSDACREKCKWKRSENRDIII